MEFIEINTLFGANIIIFYNGSHSKKVGKYLHYYETKGRITVIPWHIPNAIKRIHYHGQIANIFDCLYRTKDKTKYTVFLDLDEIIVPKKALTWDNMLGMTVKPKHYRPGGYVFLCRFFQKCKHFNVPAELPKHIEREAAKYKINSIKIKAASTKFFNYTIRSKLIIDPQAVHMLHIHKVKKYISNYGDVLVHPSVGLLHHYRHFDEHCSNSSEHNLFIRKFATQILDRVKYTHTHVETSL